MTKNHFEMKKILLIQVSRYGFARSNIFGELIKKLKRKAEVSKNYKPSSYSELMNWCTDADCVVFDFWVDNNTEIMNCYEQISLVALTRTIFELKKPVLVSRPKQELEWRSSSIFVEILKESKANGEVFVYQTTNELLEEIDKKLL